MTQVLARKDRALSPEETEALLRSRLGDAIGDAGVEFGSFIVWVSPGGWHAAVQLCRDEPLLAYDMFDCLFGVDARDEGFDVVAVLYSTSTGNRISLRTRCDGGRDAPVCPTVTDIYRGSDWMERETWDMFGIEFEGHPGLEPRLLTVENFEGWPLRKDFHLTARVAKPWPGVKEPAELDEDGNVIERVPEVGDAPGPYELDKAMAEQAKAANAPSIEAAAEEAEAAVEATEAAEHDAAELEAESTDAPSTGEDAKDHRDAGPSAAEKAEARRKEQAEARRQKAQERAEQTPDGADDQEDDA